jgi:hypothetical protein
MFGHSELKKTYWSDCVNLNSSGISAWRRGSHNFFKLFSFPFFEAGAGLCCQTRAKNSTSMIGNCGKCDVVTLFVTTDAHTVELWWC